MAFLINRNPPARIQCLHALCKLIDSKYEVGVPFRMNDIKYDPDALNIHSFCEILIENSSIGIKYCRYKENPFNLSGCSLTNGISEDSTKSKEISNTINSLHALGFVERVGNNIFFTSKGSIFSKSKFDSIEMLVLIRESVLNYGLFVGMLFNISMLGKNEFDTTEISLGYPKANEQILYKGQMITISSGSEDDSITRTKSCLLAWATTAGFIYPLPIIKHIDYDKPHVSSSEYILQTSRNHRKYKIVDIPKYIFDGSFITQKPLDYKNLTKNIGALRENNQQDIRELTLMLEPKIQNRRFAVLYLLNIAFIKQKTLDLNKLVDFMLENEELFVIEPANLYNTMCEEINIAFLSGIPFLITQNNELKPMTGINIQELNKNAPVELIKVLNTFHL